MDGISPAVRSLWRLLDLLQAEELEWSNKRKAAEEAETISNQFILDVINNSNKNRSNQDNIIGNAKITNTQKDKYSATVDNDDVFRPDALQINLHEETRVHSSRTRVHSSRTKVPSLKRDHAPSPPVSRDPASPVCKSVSTSDILPADQHGWLIDQLRGRKVWCAISKTLLCVFESRTSQTSKHVIWLPGCHIRHLELKSVHQEGKVLNGVARHFVSKPVSVVDKFQFILENPVNRQKYMFGAASITELNQWLHALEEVCGLNTSPQQSAFNTSENQPCFNTSENLPGFNTSENQPGFNTSQNLPGFNTSQNLPGFNTSPHLRDTNRLDRDASRCDDLKAYDRRASFETRTIQNTENDSSSRIHIFSRTKPVLTNNSWCLSSTVSADNLTLQSEYMQKIAQEERMGANSNSTPLKRNHSFKDNSETSFTRRKDGSWSSRSPFKIKSPLDVIFWRKKKSGPAAEARNKLNAANNVETISDHISTPRSTDIQTSFRSDLNQTFPSDKKSPKKYVRDKKDIHDTNPSSPQRLVDAPRNSRGRGLGFSLRRAASDLKDKLLGVGSATDVPISKPSGIKRRDLTEIRMSGCLRYRQDQPKMTKMHCVLSRGCFYAFRSENMEEVPELALALNQSTVTYTAAVEGRTESLFTFKVIQPNCQGIFLSADDPKTLMAWLMAMQLESAKILTKGASTCTIGETQVSSNDKMARNTTASETTFSQVCYNPAQANRHSCPHFEDTDLSLLENSTNPGRQEETEMWNDYHQEPNNNLINIKQNVIKGDKSTDICSDKKASLQSPHFTATTTQENQVVTETADTVLLQPSHETDQCHGNLHFAKTLAAQCSSEFSLNTGEFNLRSVQPFPRLSQSTSSAHIIQFSQPAQRLTEESTLKRSSSLGKNHFQQSCLGDVQKVILNDSFLAVGVNVPEKDRSFFAKDYPRDILSSDLSTTNQIYSESLLQKDEAIVGLLPTNCNQSVTDCTDQPFRFGSSVHDDVLKQAWSTDEGFLLEVVKQKLRAREKMDATNIPIGRAKDDVCIVNDQWNAMETHEISLPVRAEQTMNAQPPYSTPLDCNMGDCGQVSTLDKSGQDTANQSPDKGRRKGGFLEMFGFDNQWERHWCVLCNDCLCCYRTPDEKVPTEVIHLAGYDLTVTSDQIQGKQCILILKHLRKTRIVLSASSTEESMEWFESIKLTLDSLTKLAIKQDVLVQAGKSQTSEENKQSSSSETVKQKLLAEVLRQKLELEKLHKARAGSKVELQAAGRSVSPTLCTSPVTDEDKTCLLTRLTQRRMSTQIKLNAVQKQMEAASFSSTDKKIMFQIGKRKPDLVQGHSEIDRQRPDLELQARLLSSKLKELDSCLLSHGAASPNIQSRVRPRGQRHSYDQALLKRIQLEAESRTDVSDDIDRGIFSKPKDKEKLKDINRNISLKTSVQKFAHKTFAKANWYLSKKYMNQTDGKGSPKTSISNNLSDVTPDVIDGTNSNQTNRIFYGQDIPEPTDSFQSDNSFICGAVPGHHKAGSNYKPCDPVLSKFVLSPSFAKQDNFSGPIRTSASSPLLSKLAIKQEKEVSQNDTEAILKMTEADFKENTKLSVHMSASRQGSSGSLAQKRQVSASALAEIEAFEELSMKFLAGDAGSK